jgi:cytochrome c oxidase cbb3-type subunit 1
VYAGVNDANVQWWYGHNAVAFVLTTPILGMMYYFIPKQSGNPIFSHRLSIVHFWSLIFLYIWAGPHHLIYTSLPDWAQTLGTVFSVMLILPSWGGMLNGFLTLKGSWHKLRTDPILKFLVLGITFYGMSTFEGPMMAVKSVNALTHYSNYTIGHVHGGALGWVAFTSFAALYYMVPRVWGTRLYSIRMAESHFWIGLTGVVLYVTSMDVSGIVQGLMWRAFNPDGTLTYTFIETVAAIHVYDVIRFVGGLFFITGLFLMIANLVLTIRSGRAAEVSGAAVPVAG